METVTDIILIVLPILIVGAIALFVILSLKSKQRRGTLGKKKTSEAQTWLDSMIPLGMVFGSAGGMLFSFFFPISMATSIALGSGIGLLGGYFAYSHYSKTEETSS